MTKTERAQAITNALAFLDGKDKQDLIIEIHNNIEVLNDAVNLLLNEDGNFEKEINEIQAEIDLLQQGVNANPLVCETGQVKEEDSRIIKSQYYHTKDTTILAFDSALKVKEYVEAIPGSKASMHGSVVARNLGFRFKVPQWHYDEAGIKLWFDYDKDSVCPFIFTALESKMVKVGDTFVFHRDNWSVKSFIPNDVRPMFYKREIDWQTNLKKDQLTRLNNKNLKTATAAEMYELIQLPHPTDYGLHVDRANMLQEWERRGKEIFMELGFPVDMDYPYMNKHTGYQSISKLKGELFYARNVNLDRNSKYWSVADNWLPIADFPQVVDYLQKELERYQTLPQPKKSDKPDKETRNTYAERKMSESIVLINEYMEEKGMVEEA